MTPFGNMDLKAVAKHNKELKRILPALQHEEWSELRDRARLTNQGAVTGKP